MLNILFLQHMCSINFLIVAITCMKKSNYKRTSKWQVLLTKEMICQGDYQSIYDVMTSYLYELLYCYIALIYKIIPVYDFNQKPTALHAIKAWLGH